MFNCSSVPNFYIIAFWSLSQKHFRIATQAVPSPHGASSLVQMHMWQPIKGHHCTVSEEESHSRATSTNKFHFLSLGSYRSKSPSSWKLKNKCINPKFPEPESNQNSAKFVAILRDSSLNLHHRIASSAIQAPSSSPLATNSARSQKQEDWEEEGKKSHRIRIQKKEEGSETCLPVEIRSQGSRETVQSPNQNTGNTETSSYLFENHHRFRINVNP